MRGSTDCKHAASTSAVAIPDSEDAPRESAVPELALKTLHEGALSPGSEGTGALRRVGGWFPLLLIALRVFLLRPPYF